MKNLTGYFLDKRMNVLGLVSSTIPNALRLESDNEFESIEEGTTIFEGVVSYYGADEAGSDFVKVGNYFLYEDEDGVSKAYTIIDTEKDRKRNEISFYAEDAGLSLLNSYTFPYEAVKDMNIASYFELFLKGSGFEIGTNELGDAYSRKLKWEGNATITERLLSVATQFDHADINFSFVVKGMRVTEKYVNIYKKRGIATNVTLQLNREIDNIITSESIKNLATSVLAKGGTPEGQDKPITLKGYVPKVPDERFFIEGEFLRDRDSNEIWSSFLSEGEGAKGGYIEKPFDYDTLSKEELYNRSVNHLKRVSQIEQNFEVDIALLPDNVRIGDTIQIVDQEDNLYLQARVLKMEKSRSLDKYVATLGEYLIKESGINQRLQELADRIAAIPRGATDYLWIRYADDNKGNGFSASPTNKSYMAIKHALNQPVPSDDPKDYEGLWVLIQGEKGIPGEPGDDGLPTYTWIRYADNVSGSGISDKPEGKMYIGFAYNKPTPTPSDIPKDYAWSAMYDEAKMLELQEQINNIQIGGTNLIRDSALDEGFKYYDTAGNLWTVDTNKKFMGQNTIKYQWQSNAGPYPAVLTKHMEVREAGMVGKDATLSVYVYIPPDATLSNDAYFELAGYEHTGQTSNATIVGSRGNVPADAPKGVWFRCEIQFKISDTTTNGKTNYVKALFRHRAFDGTVKDKFYYALPQLEFGNKVSDWNRNPLDTPTTADLSNVQTELQQQLGSIVVPVMQPNRPIAKEGMVWWKTDVTGDVIGIEKYVGGKWEKQVIQQDTLNIVNLNAVKITGSEITGTEISGSTIISAFDEEIVVGTNIYKRGILKLDKGDLKNEFEVYNKNAPDVITAKGTVRVSPDGIQTSLFDSQGKLDSASQYSVSGIAINKPSMPYGTVNLGYNDLIAISETAFTSNMYAPGFAQYGAGQYDQPRYSRNNRLIQLSGVIRNNVVIQSGKNAVMATLPTEIRPSRMVRFINQGSGMNRYMLSIYPDGNVFIDRYGVSSHIEVIVGSYINIACTYVAGN